MQVEHINPFIHSLSNTFQTMLNCSVTRGELALASPGKGLFEVNGIIGLTGKVVGTVVLSFEEPLALYCASTLLMMEANEINEDVTDAVGEITNMVAGAAKAKLEKYELSLSLPNVVIGKPLNVAFPSKIPPVLIPFSSEHGDIKMQVGLATKEATVAGKS